MKRFSDLPCLALVRGLGLVPLLALVLAVCIPVVAVAGDQQGAGSQAAAGPVIMVWQGTTQDFGTRGDPQLWVNILGNVQGADQLQYSLNGSAYIDIARSGGSGSRALTLDDAIWHPGGVGQDQPPEGDWGGDELDALGPGELLVSASSRLVSPGDFNIEIDTQDLRDGKNTVLIRPNNDNESVKAVTVNYSAGNTWELPYRIDWSQVADIAEVAQIVDGQWQLNEDGIRPTVIGYDRVVAIGDLDWQDYDVIVPITIHAFPQSDVGGVGVAARWVGHFQVADEQPGAGWWNMGAYGLYRNRLEAGVDRSKLWMYTGHYEIVRDESGFQIDPDIPYYFRMRVQTKNGADSGFYSFKVWKVGATEPAGWTFAVQDSKPAGWLPGQPKESPLSGSVLLVAHEVDATFGDVEIRPLLELSVFSAGSGRVQTSPELAGESAAYLYGDAVRLEALADPGWIFVGWSGDQMSTQNPVTLTLTSDTEIVATFGLARSLDVDIAGNGSVVRDPEQEQYAEGAVVLLMPNPSSGWRFSGWGGPDGAKVRERGDGTWSLVVDSNMAVTAIFGPSQIFLPIVNRAR